jgi:predicted Zn-dependent peptidase
MAFKGTPWVGTKDASGEAALLAAEDAAWQALLDERRRGRRADPQRLASLEQAFKRAQEAARATVESNEFSRILEQAGAKDLNAFTTSDFTGYQYSIPSNRLELWAAMEGGRMAHPVFREFHKERDVVVEERRMRAESSPIGRLLYEYIHTAFVAHPYGFGGIGHASDLMSFTRPEGDTFFKRHYVAPNMTIAVVGDVPLADLKAHAERYFSDIPAGPMPPPIDTVEPEQKAERRVYLEDAAQPVIGIGWKIPAGTDPSYPAYEALASLIGGGDYARLQKVLVKEKKVAAQLQAFTGLPGQKYPNLLTVFVVPAAGQDPEAVEREVHAVLDDIAAGRRPLTAEELEGYKVRTRAARIGAAESNASLAQSLAVAQTLFGDWREFFREQERVQALTVADLETAMKRSLVRTNRTVAMIVNPKPAAAAEGGR